MLWVLFLGQINWLHLGSWYSQSLLRETDLCLVIQQKEFSVDTSLEVLEKLQGKIGWASNPKVEQKDAIYHLQSCRDQGRKDFYSSLPLGVEPREQPHYSSWDYQGVAPAEDAS